MRRRCRLIGSVAPAPRRTQRAARRAEVKMAARAPVAGGGRLLDTLRKWYYNAAGFNKLGLMRDDTLYEDDDVKEALRRLPEHLYNERTFRIKRALDLSLKHQILPKDQWVKYEEVCLECFHSLVEALSESGS
ncbi:cytochrome b-c1 complex subunit 7 [Pogoniulus pusillus]|uniref:cytochrome b-c1 complex subunit 7 n=1 Tax=Pogoniulus pusillus TaxID=488313 RepID=UPI0030B9AA2D